MPIGCLEMRRVVIVDYFRSVGRLTFRVADDVFVGKVAFGVRGGSGAVVRVVEDDIHL